MNDSLSNFLGAFNRAMGDTGVDKYELLGEVEAMRDELRARIDTMPTRATNPIPAIDGCDDVDLRLV